MLDPALREMLTETLLIAPFLERDEFGVASYGPAVATPCRIQRRILTAFTATGRQLIPETKIFVDGNAVITTASQLTMPDGTSPPIQGLQVSKDEHGVLDHYTIFL